MYLYALLVGEAVGRAIEEQREWGVDGRKFRIGKRTKPLLGVVVADVESGGGSLRRLRSRRRGGDDNGWGRQTAADGGARSTLAAGVVVCVVCRVSLLSRGRAITSFVIHPPKKNAEPMMIETFS